MDQVMIVNRGRHIEFNFLTNEQEFADWIDVVPENSKFEPIRLITDHHGQKVFNHMTLKNCAFFNAKI